MIFDDGYQYGLGAFETMAVYKKEPLFMNEHLERLNKTLVFLGITQIVTKEDIQPFIAKKVMDYYAIKILVSEKNLLVKEREIPYNKIRYDKGFDMEFSKIRRNHTSPFVFHKTLNYGECIMEKRIAQKMNLDEMIFLNLNDEICEGTTCNIFFVKNGHIFTPKLSCGLLPGIIRNYICKTFDVSEVIIKPSQVSDFDECFVTNSLMGIMPVHSIAHKIFEKKSIIAEISDHYFHNVISNYNPII